MNVKKIFKSIIVGISAFFTCYLFKRICAGRDISDNGNRPSILGGDDRSSTTEDRELQERYRNSKEIFNRIRGKEQKEQK